MKSSPLSLGTTLALLAAAAIGLSGCTSLPGEGTTRAGTGSYECAQAGRSSPVVVFEAGAGEAMDTWNPVFPRVAEFSTAFVYSRRGEGRSTPASSERDGAVIVEQLRELLAERGLRPPYVLVGHSLGGLYMQLFAKLHPAEVAGVVLVDSTTAGWRERLKRELPTQHAILQGFTTLNAVGPLGAELRGETKTSEQWRTAGPWPRVPAIVLTATNPPPLGGAKLAELSRLAQRELVASWPGAEQRLVDSGHYIYRERTEVVVAAIRTVVERARRQAQSP